MNEESKSDGGGRIKKLAQAHMSFVMPLSPYNHDSKGFFKMDGQVSNESSSKPDSPNNQVADVPMTEEEVANNLPLQ